MKNLFLLISLTVAGLVSYAQPQFPCTGDFLFTRQVTPNTLVSKVDFSPGVITITNPGTLNPAVLSNAPYNITAAVQVKLVLPTKPGAGSNRRLDACAVNR